VDIALRNLLVRGKDSDVLAHELTPLQKISDNYPKFLLTLDEAFGTADYEGIKKVNVIDWLLEGS
jgi:predicted AAA+ superfamily ATPase